MKTGLFRRTVYDVDEKVPGSAIYECTACANITAFKKGEAFSGCPDCPEKKKGQGWYETNEVLTFVTKNLNTEFQRLETFSTRLAEMVADFAGNIWFAYFHVLWFSAWIYLNTGVRNSVAYGGFDPYPFPFLVLVVSLEAIFLATFILIAQNLQSQRSELRADIDYQVNLKTEKDVGEMLAILNDIREGKLFLTKDRRIVLERKD